MAPLGTAFTTSADLASQIATITADAAAVKVAFMIYSNKRNDRLFGDGYTFQKFAGVT